MIINLETYLVVDGDQLDYPSTIAKLRLDLLKIEQERITEELTFKNQIFSLLDKHVSLFKPSLIGMSLSQLNIPPEKYFIIKSRLNALLQKLLDNKTLKIKKKKISR